MGISSATKYFRAPDAQCANYLDKSLFEWRPRPGWPSSRSYPETGKKGGVGHPDVGDPVDSIAQPSKGGGQGGVASCWDAVDPVAKWQNPVLSAPDSKVCGPRYTAGTPRG